MNDKHQIVSDISNEMHAENSILFDEHSHRPCMHQSPELEQNPNASENISRSSFNIIEQHPEIARRLRIVSWNVEGLSLQDPCKFEELKKIMRTNHIDIICFQESHIKGHPVFYDEDFLCILSGHCSDDREYAGVGFLVSPHICSCVKSFLQFSNRLMCLRLRVQGGLLTFVNSYVPQNGRQYEERADFFDTFFFKFCDEMQTI